MAIFNNSYVSLPEGIFSKSLPNLELPWCQDNSKQGPTWSIMVPTSVPQPSSSQVRLRCVQSTGKKGKAHHDHQDIQHDTVSHPLRCEPWTKTREETMITTELKGSFWGQKMPVDTGTHRIHGAGIYAKVWGILMVNVTIYSIHGSYGV